MKMNTKNSKTPVMPNESNGRTEPEKFVVPRRKAKPGNPGKFCDRTANTIIRALSAGLSKEQAARACKISKETLYSWCERSPEFGEAVDAAREVARQNALQGIKDAGAGDWKAYTAWLKYAFPNDYRERFPAVTLNTQNNTIICNEETRRQIQEMRKKLLGNPEGLNGNNNHELNDRAIEAELVEEKEEVAT
jgi:hypothetical protein